VSYRDMVGFGRRAVDVPAATLTNEVNYEVGALDAFARIAGTRVRYVKPHGALYNRIVHDEVQAAAVVEAVRTVDPTLVGPVGCKNSVMAPDQRFRLRARAR